MFCLRSVENKGLIHGLGGNRAALMRRWNLLTRKDFFFPFFFPSFPPPPFFSPLFFTILARATIGQFPWP